MAITRIELLGVPVDVCPPDELGAELLRILEKPGAKQIVFLSVWDLLRARNKKRDFGECLRNADLILPISKSIISGAKFVKLSAIPIRYNPFDATILMLSVLDQYYKSLFLLGGRKKTLQQAERNVRETFPNLRIVGRYVGYFPKNSEESVITAIHKAAPSMAILSEGIKEKNLWVFRRRERFSKSIFLFYHDCFGIFSKRIKRISEKTFEKGMEVWNEIAHNPFKIFYIIPYTVYIILLIWCRFSESRAAKKAAKLENEKQQENQGETEQKQEKPNSIDSIELA